MTREREALPLALTQGDPSGIGPEIAIKAWGAARDNGGPKLRLQMLAYPVTDGVARTESYRQFFDGYGLNAPTMEWFYDHYTPDKTMRDDWRLSPLRAKSLTGLPPALSPPIARRLESMPIDAPLAATHFSPATTSSKAPGKRASGARR